MADNLCWGCKDRAIDCHVNCSKYKEFEKKREKVREVKAKEREFYGARTQGIKYKNKASFRKNYSKL